jgi:uncharacterized protein YeaO (DUF488 family)
MILLKRAYEPASPKDGYRILVDRLWPRGIKKQDLKFDEWPKEISPSPELRKSFGHQVENWQSFSKAYRQELKSKEIQPKLHEIASKGKKKTVTLVYGAKDEVHNHARILKDVLEKEK